MPQRPLTDRENQIVRLVAQGKSNPQIAMDLGISLQSVKNHLTTIFNKTGMYSRGAIAARYARNGLLEELIAIAPVDANDLEAMKEDG